MGDDASAGTGDTGDAGASGVPVDWGTTVFAVARTGDGVRATSGPCRGSTGRSAAPAGGS